MDSSGFHQLVKNYTNLTQEENAEAAKLSKQYPYSQILHLIRARAARDLAAPDREQLLHVSAVYSTDRGILKQVMSIPRQARVAVAQAEVLAEKKTEELKKEEVKKVAPSTPVREEPAPQPQATPKAAPNLLSGEALRADIYQELEKLQRLKKDFQTSVEEYEKGIPAGHLSAPESQKSEKTETEPLIEEIKVTRKKVKVESPKQQEQNEIIDQFIKSKAVLPKTKSEEPAEDLAEDSSLLSDNVVSETLVNLLVKQGKKDKAIEVLKKLIWKFPQKKAYFAAQIESLKS